METTGPVIVDHQNLNPETLASVIDSFITREGTDYGAQEIHLETKREQLLKQLSRGEIKLVFDPETESVTLMTKNQLKKLSIFDN